MSIKNADYISSKRLQISNQQPPDTVCQMWTFCECSNETASSTNTYTYAIDLIYLPHTKSTSMYSKSLSHNCYWIRNTKTIKTSECFHFVCDSMITFFYFPALYFKSFLVRISFPSQLNQIVEISNLNNILRYMSLNFDDFSTKFKSRIDTVACLWSYFHPNAAFTQATINDCNIWWDIDRIYVIYTSNYEIWRMKSLQLYLRHN